MLLRKKTVALFVLLSFVLTSCEFHCSVGGKGPTEKDDKKEAKIQNGSALYNDINLTSTGNVHVKRAYLANEKGERIAEGNYIEPVSKTYLNIVLDSSWTVVEGKAYIGAAQKVVTDAGTVILDQPDMSSEIDGGKVFNLSLTLNPKSKIPPTGLTITFKAWDKKGPGEITGSYKLNIK